ncbi:MAG: TonB-dependent receptor [Steroidobacteraceae bacterium]
MKAQIFPMRATSLAILAATALASALGASVAVAQETPSIQEVIVTGSRIARASDFDSPSPVITVDRDAIAKSGYSNLQQLMEKLPSNGNGAFSTRGNNQDSTANGAASISLRGLGADATLVLVNGRRVSISPFAESITTNFVDINSIPVAAIERVEILKDGSSAIYGSDAVAGVVNVILRKNFQGLEVSAGYGGVTSGPYDETTASVLWGLGGDNSNVTMIFDYFKNSTLGNADRGHLGSANQSALGGADNRSSRSFPGNFIVSGLDPTPTIKIDPACPAARRSGQTCLFDYGPYNLLIPAAERSGLTLLAHQDLHGGVELFGELGVQHNNSIAQGAPTPLDNTAGLTVPVTHPNNPFVGATAITIRRLRTVDAGPRRWTIGSDTLRGLVGLRGKVRDWDWEVAMQRARGESDQTGDRSQGWVRTDFLQQEINAGRYNPFGATFNPQSEINAITTSLVRRGNANLTTYDADITGKLFNMPAGDVRMAAGAEYRKESVSDIPDDQFQRGLIFGTEAVSAAASRHSSAAYVEFSVPLYKGLELSLAGRYDDYSDFGSTTNPKVALRWAPIDTLALRGSWSRGFRAPSLAQVGLGPSQDSLFITDTYGAAVNPAYGTPTDITITFAGNPNLKPEKSDSLNIGAAWRPAGGAEFTVDYWDIKQKNKIDRVPVQYLYTTFCNDQNSTVCVRGAPLPGQRLGSLNSINSSFINIGEQKAKGVDLGGYYSMEAGPGKLALNLNYSRLIKFERVELNNAGTALVTHSLEGKYEYPQDRATLTADWGNDRWGVYGAVNYIGSFVDQDGTTDLESPKTRSVASFTTLNLQFRYTGIKQTRIVLGLDNALDQKVPFAIGDGDTDLYGYVSSQHNPRGRFWNAKATFSF